MLHSNLRASIRSVAIVLLSGLLLSLPVAAKDGSAASPQRRQSVDRDLYDRESGTRYLEWLAQRLAEWTRIGTVNEEDGGGSDPGTD